MANEDLDRLVEESKARLRRWKEERWAPPEVKMQRRLLKQEEKAARIIQRREKAAQSFAERMIIREEERRRRVVYAEARAEERRIRTAALLVEKDKIRTERARIRNERREAARQEKEAKRREKEVKRKENDERIVRYAAERAAKKQGKEEAERRIIRQQILERQQRRREGVPDRFDVCEGLIRSTLVVDGVLHIELREAPIWDMTLLVVEQSRVYDAYDDVRLASRQPIPESPRGTKVFMPFAKARAFVRKRGFKNRRQFCDWANTPDRPPSLPKWPQEVYKARGVWKGWADFLGNR